MGAAMGKAASDEGCIGLAVQFRNKELGFEWFGSPHDVLVEMARAGINVRDAAHHLQTEISMRHATRSRTSFGFKGGPYAETLMKILDALAQGNRDDAHAALDGYPGVLTDDYDGAALPLIVFGVTGNVDSVRFLLDRGADVNRSDGIQMTALHWAAVFGQSQVAEILIASGANLSLRSHFFLTAAHLAQLNSHPELAARLAGGVSVPEGGALMMHITDMMSATP